MRGMEKIRKGDWGRKWSVIDKRDEGVGKRR